MSGWTKDGSPLMVERLGRADLAGITREGEELQVQQHLIPGTFPRSLARSNNKTNARAPFLCRGCCCGCTQRLVLYSYMMYLETIFRTCTRISRERGKFVRGMIVLDLTGAKKRLLEPFSYKHDHLP
eukprot:COSAG06_NODE_1538_length_9150_cov_102.886200_3_plen_127_part_00